MAGKPIKQKRERGRPTKFVPKYKNAILDNIKLGMPFEFATAAAKVDYSTFRNWMVKGEKDKKGEYFDFLEQVQEAEAIAVRNNLARIAKASIEGSWQAAAWILARRHPEHFSENSKVNVKSENKNENINVNIRSPEEIEQEILDKLTRIRSKRDSE
jgi:hypothetical protein